MNNTKIVKLKTNDNKIFEVSIDILHKAKFISDILESTNDDEVIFLKEVDSVNLERIIDYLNHYKDMEPKEVPKPFPEETDETFFKSILNDEWTFEYLQKFNLDNLFNLINSAEYLKIDGLVSLLSAKVAYEMCNCSIDAARNKFGIESDMTEEEVAEFDKYPLD